jgi:hypothetical protein
LVWTVPAAAVAATPQAELSIEPPSSQLSVTFVASSTGFPAPIVHYIFRFGDGTKTGKIPNNTVAHTYQHAGQFAPQVEEIDALGNTATTTATLAVDPCSAGSSCSKILQGVSSVAELRVTGPTDKSMPAGLDLFVGTSQIMMCEAMPDTNASATDSGFIGNLTLTVVYKVPTLSGVNTTCFFSVVPFTNTAGNSTNSGKLPKCSGSQPTPPCVISIGTKPVSGGFEVIKKLLIPPGDPTVGSV